MGPTSVCEGLDVVRQVNVHTFCILHFLEDDPNKPHGHKVVPVKETQTQPNKIQLAHVYFMLALDHTAEQVL